VVENLGKGGTGEDLNRCSPTKKFVLIGGIGVISSGFAGHLNGYPSPLEWRDNPEILRDAELPSRFAPIEKLKKFNIEAYFYWRQ
jgi:hypothetical protein